MRGGELENLDHSESYNVSSGEMTVRVVWTVAGLWGPDWERR